MKKTTGKTPKAWQKVAALYAPYGGRTKLAKQVGCSRVYISRLLRGKHAPSLKVAVRLESITGIPAREFTKL